MSGSICSLRCATTCIPHFCAVLYVSGNRRAVYCNRLSEKVCHADRHHGVSPPLPST